MAAKKKSRKHTKKKSQKAPNLAPENPVRMRADGKWVIDKPSQSPNVLQDAGQLGDNLADKVRNLFASKPPEAEQVSHPEDLTEDSSTMSQTPSSESASNVSQLAETVAQVHERFGPSPDAQQGGSASSEPPPPIDPGPGVVEPPDHDFIPRETVREVMEITFSATGNPLSDNESRALTPLTVDMVNEQGPRLFGESENRALWVWLTVMSIFIAARSEAGGKLIQWLADLITGAKSKSKVAQPKEEKKAESSPDGKKDSTQPEAASIKPGSLAFKEGSGFQVPERQP